MMVCMCGVNACVCVCTFCCSSIRPCSTMSISDLRCGNTAQPISIDTYVTLHTYAYIRHIYVYVLCIVYIHVYVYM